jgi:hypothetical protein
MVNLTYKLHDCGFLFSHVPYLLHDVCRFCCLNIRQFYALTSGEESVICSTTTWNHYTFDNFFPPLEDKSNQVS